MLRRTCRSGFWTMWRFEERSPFMLWAFPWLLSNTCAGCAGEFSGHSHCWWRFLSAGWSASHHPQQYRPRFGVWTAAFQLQQVGLHSLCLLDAWLLPCVLEKLSCCCDFLILLKVMHFILGLCYSDFEWVTVYNNPYLYLSLCFSAILSWFRNKGF